MAAAALDHRHPRLGNEPQHLGCLGPHVLGTRMTGEMEADAAIDRRQPVGQAMRLGDVDDVFGEIEGRLGQALDGQILVQDQRPFELQHQRAGRRERHDVVSLVDPRQQRLGDVVGCLRNRLQVAQLELGHATAGRMDDFGLDAIFGQYSKGRGADIGIVEVHEAGRVEHGLAFAEGRCRPVHFNGLAMRAHLEGLAGLARKTCAVVNAGDLLHAAAHRLVALVGRPVDQARGESAEPAGTVGVPCFFACTARWRSMRWGKSTAHSCGGT